jgi:hypothetical protein
MRSVFQQTYLAQSETNDAIIEVPIDVPFNATKMATLPDNFAGVYQLVQVTSDTRFAV